MSAGSICRQLRYAVVLLAAVATGVAPRVSSRLTPYVAQPLPLRAMGDLDGDGRADLAVIEDTHNGAVLMVQLSGSMGSAHLDTGVTTVIERDVDQDGDLDLVAATATGEVLIWINDGRGHFTQQPPSRRNVIRAEASFSEGSPRDAVTPAPPPVFTARAPSWIRYGTTTQRRPPNAPHPLAEPTSLLPPLRAPPAVAL